MPQVGGALSYIVNAYNMLYTVATFCEAFVPELAALSYDCLVEHEVEQVLEKLAKVGRRDPEVEDVPLSTTRRARG